MIKPVYKKRWDWAWSWYLGRIIRKDFYAFEFDPAFPVDPDRGLLLIGNHFSWWDGFWTYRLGELLFKKRHHVMALESTLEQYPSLRAIGAFSIKQGTRAVQESLAYAASLLEEPRNMVVMFPQGEIQSMHVRQPDYKRGVWLIMRKVQRPIQVVFCVALVDYASRRRPTVRFHLKEFDVENASEADLETAWLEQIDRAKEIQTEKLYRPFP